MASYRCRDCKHFRGKWGVSGCAKGCSADPRIGTYYSDGYKSVMAGCVMFERSASPRIYQEERSAVA